MTTHIPSPAPAFSRDSIEEAYCFLHQKQRVYQYSTDQRQREDIEYAVESFADTMSAPLYASLSRGDTTFLRDYTRFAADLDHAVAALEALLG